MKVPLESASPLAKVWASCFLSWTFSGKKYGCGMPTELPHMCNIQVVCGNHSLRATKPMRDESVKVLVAQSCPTLCNSMGCSLTGSSLSMEFSMQDYCSGLPFPSPGDLPNPEIKLGTSCIASRFFSVWKVKPQGSPLFAIPKQCQTRQSVV